METAVLGKLKDLDQRQRMYGQLQIDVEIQGDNLTEANRRLFIEQAQRSSVFNLAGLDLEIRPTVTTSNTN